MKVYKLECEDGWLICFGYGIGIKEYSDWPTIPQLYVDKEFLGGVDIVVAMHSNGELSKLFNEKKVLVPLDGEEPSK